MFGNRLIFRKYFKKRVSIMKGLGLYSVIGDYYETN